jgi:hypothetical protein
MRYTHILYEVLKVFGSWFLVFYHAINRGELRLTVEYMKSEIL